MRITLPFPPAALSGHANGNNRWGKIALTRQWRVLAYRATQAAGVAAMPDVGDIHIDFLFTPPDRRGDRTNYPSRLKPMIDGIADALGVNDRRFLPSYQFAEPCKPGSVTVTIGDISDPK